MDTTFKTDKGVFNYRVGAIILDGTKALMAYDPRHKQYYSVGGRVHFGESSEQAVLREVYEETGVKAEIDRLGFVHENFFEIDGMPFHELAFFYYIKPFDYGKINFEAVKCDGESEKILWVDLKNEAFFEGKMFFPEFFKTELLANTKEIKHIITVE